LETIIFNVQSSIINVTMGLFESESKFESSVKVVPYSQQAVYDNISDLRNLEKVRDRVPEDKVNDFTFDQDTVSLNVAPVGELKLRICEREEPKCVKFETVQSPVPFNVWIQVLPVDEVNAKMKVTLKAELNPFIKGMVEKPLQDGVEKIADALAQIQYT
jgi:Polyketide cyclase / dehydrase and lipid transport.